MTNEPSSEQPELPALSDAELRETLDRLGDLSLRVYDQVQEQTKAINHVATAANEARRAAKSAEQQTDPEQYADFAVRLIDERTGEILGKMNQTSSDLSAVANHAQGVLRKVEDDGSASYRAIWEREQKVDRFKVRLSWIAGGFAILFVVCLLVLPRFIASVPSGCAVLGGLWTATTTGVPICVLDSNDALFW
jgi:hypothetical protein